MFWVAIFIFLQASYTQEPPFFYIAMNFSIKISIRKFFLSKMRWFFKIKSCMFSLSFLCCLDRNYRSVTALFVIFAEGRQYQSGILSCLHKTREIQFLDSAVIWKFQRVLKIWRLSCVYGKCFTCCFPRTGFFIFFFEFSSSETYLAIPLKREYLIVLPSSKEVTSAQ